MAAKLQAFVQSIDFLDAGRVRVIAVVTDGTQKAVREVITSSLDALKTQLRTTLEAVTDAEDFKTLLPGTEIDLSVPPPPPPPPPPTQDELVFREAWLLVQAAQRKIAAGLIATDDPDAAAILIDAQKLYRPAYLGIG